MPFEMMPQRTPIAPKSPDSTPPETQSENQESKLEKFNRYTKELETEATEIREQLKKLPEHDPLKYLDITEAFLKYEYTPEGGFNTEKPASPDTIRKILEQEYNNYKKRTSELELTDERLEEMSRAQEAYTELLEIFTDPNRTDEQKRCLSDHDDKWALELDLAEIEGNLSRLKTIRNQLERDEKMNAQAERLRDGYEKFQRLEEREQRILADPKYQEIMSSLEKLYQQKNKEKKVSNF